MSTPVDFLRYGILNALFLVMVVGCTHIIYICWS